MTLSVAAFLLAPTVASVHVRVTDLHIDRHFPWELWQWTDEPEPWILPPDCSRKDRHMESEVTQWPSQIHKDDAFTLRGFVDSIEEPDVGVEGIEIDLFLNETKSEPGTFLGSVETGPGGYFTLLTSVPFSLEAKRYHLVAHAKDRQRDCTFYHEHWSDPEMDVVTSTRIEWAQMDRAIVGREFDIAGRLVDEVGAGVGDVDLRLSIGGKLREVTTDGDGRFGFPYAPQSPGNLSVAADFRGNRYYLSVRNETRIAVDSEGVELEGSESGLRFVRSSPITLQGHVYVADAKRGDDVTLKWTGFRVAACANCPANATLTVPVDENGAFEATLLVPATQKGGNGTLVLSGGGLDRTYGYAVALEIPTSLALEASGEGLFTRGYHAQALLTDEVGRPIDGQIAFLGPDGWKTGRVDPAGKLAVAGASECGRQALRAYYNGTASTRASDASAEASVCSFLALIPPWLLAAPWWTWPLVAIVAFALWRLGMGLRQRYSPTIRGGIPLALKFTQPADEAPDHAGVGEPVVATASLEGPLPDGHRLRMGFSRAASEQPLDAELRAHYRMVPDKLGELSVRAEIVDEKGRVVVRRTLTLHVVRYAEEIERRYLRLRRASGAGDHVTPREFEAWLHERAPALDAEVVTRLVRLFEEADYSPRVAGRAEFVSYLVAERGVPEVSARAST